MTMRFSQNSHQCNWGEVLVGAPVRTTKPDTRGTFADLVDRNATAKASSFIVVLTCAIINSPITTQSNKYAYIRKPPGPSRKFRNLNHPCHEIVNNSFCWSMKNDRLILQCVHHFVYGLSCCSVNCE